MLKDGAKHKQPCCVKIALVVTMFFFEKLCLTSVFANKERKEGGNLFSGRNVRSGETSDFIIRMRRQLAEELVFGKRKNIWLIGVLT